jgi:bifunctional non-homologous end joining protein LigD
MVRKHEDRVRVFSRRGADWTARYPRIVQAAKTIKASSFLLDGEGVVYDGKGMPRSALLHSREYDKEVSLAAFDLLELGGTEVRKQPLGERKSLLSDLLKKIPRSEGAGDLRACRPAGHEGIVAKRGPPIRKWKSHRWLKLRNPKSPAMQRYEDGTF